jgi:hypothetical protein
MDFRLMDQSQEHVTVVINKTHFALTRHFYLVKLHFNYVSRVFNLLGLRFTRNDIEESDNLRLHGVNDSQNIV